MSCIVRIHVRGIAVCSRNGDRSTSSCREPGRLGHQPFDAPRELRVVEVVAEHELRHLGVHRLRLAGCLTAARPYAWISGSRVSMHEVPSAGTVHTTNTAWRTRSPRSPTIAGIEQPASECPTRTNSSKPAASTSSATASAQSANVTDSSGAGWRPRPGRSTAMAGAARWGRSGSQHRLSNPPPWTSTKGVIRLRSGFSGSECVEAARRAAHHLGLRVRRQ